MLTERPFKLEFCLTIVVRILTFRTILYIIIIINVHFIYLICILLGSVWTYESHIFHIYIYFQFVALFCSSMIIICWSAIVSSSINQTINLFSFFPFLLLLSFHLFFYIKYSLWTNTHSLVRKNKIKTWKLNRQRSNLWIRLLFYTNLVWLINRLRSFVIEATSKLFIFEKSLGMWFHVEHLLNFFFHLRSDWKHSTFNEIERKKKHTHKNRIHFAWIIWLHAHIHQIQTK